MHRFIFMAIILSVGFIQPVFAGCKTSKDDSWICANDKAWVDGYLVIPSKMRELFDSAKLLVEVVEQRDGYKALLEESIESKEALAGLAEELKNLLDQSQLVTLEYKDQRDKTEAELKILEGEFESKLIEIEECKISRNEDWRGWEVGLLTAGVSIVSVFVGAGAYAIFQ